MFGYGSLMWNPGFPHAERKPALAHGVHRRLCVWSTRYRGTPDNPASSWPAARRLLPRHGLPVLEKDVPATRDYLTQREQVTKVYHEVLRPVRLNDGRTVPALCYVVDQSHRQFAGRLPPEEQLDRVRTSAGSMGPNRDYVCNTAKALRSIGCRDRTLDWMADALDDGR